MRPDEAKLLLDLVLLPALTEEHGLTRKVLEAIPPEKADYRPHVVAKSANELARHIAASEKRFIDGVLRGEFHRGAVLPESVQGLKDLAIWYSETLPPAFEQLERLSSDQLAKPLNFRVRPMPAVMCLQFALKHSIHHRGQMAAYLRGMGAQVPSIYGESYEDAEARKAAKGQSVVA
jgi:uncharacterized damage-inducible protein DinB